MDNFKEKTDFIREIIKEDLLSLSLVLKNLLKKLLPTLFFWFWTPCEKTIFPFMDIFAQPLPFWKSSESPAGCLSRHFPALPGPYLPTPAFLPACSLPSSTATMSIFLYQKSFTLLKRIALNHIPFNALGKDMMKTRHFSIDRGNCSNGPVFGRFLL